MLNEYSVSSEKYILSDYFQIQSTVEEKFKYCLQGLNFSRFFLSEERLKKIYFIQFNELYRDCVEAQTPCAFVDFLCNHPVNKSFRKSLSTKVLISLAIDEKLSKLNFYPYPRNKNRELNLSKFEILKSKYNLEKFFYSKQIKNELLKNSFKYFLLTREKIYSIDKVTYDYLDQNKRNIFVRKKPKDKSLLKQLGIML